MRTYDLILFLCKALRPLLLLPCLKFSISTSSTQGHFLGSLPCTLTSMFHCRTSFQDLS